MTMALCARLSACVLAAILLSACDERETPAQLQAWIDTVRAPAPAPQSATPPLPPFIALPYQADTDHTPFGRLQPLASEVVMTRPQQRGAPQALEQFALEHLRMVGTISQAGRRHVLLQVDRMVYQAKVGDYVGKNFGMILRITDHETRLEELIPGADDRWTRRSATLSLQGEAP